MRLFKSELHKQTAELIHKNVKVRFIGSRARLPKTLVQTMSQLETNTAHNTGLTLQLAINYGGRQDLLEAFKKLAQDVEATKLKPEDITLSDISDALSTGGIADPDLIIRTSGELRLSNFLLWQAAYSEFAFVDKHWPSFNAKDFVDVIENASNRTRRFGGL
jgi:undecaprenyl diphosphate synthase